VSIGDATRIDAPDESFDAVFDFGAIHQIPDWPTALAEVSRVLKPGGLFFFEEVASPLLRRTLRFTVEGWPPERGRAFSRDSFLAELQTHGLGVGLRIADRNLLYLMTALSSGLVGDLVGVAERTHAEAQPRPLTGLSATRGTARCPAYARRTDRRRT